MTEFDAHALVLYADDSLLAVNKPAGLPSLPDGYQAGVPHLRSVLEPVYGRLWIVHRLDRDTSGVIVLARSSQVHRALNTQFQEHQTVKVYHALVAGSPGWDEQRVDAPLLPDGDRRHRSIVDARRGKPAVTEFYLLERFDGYALLEACPKTGRTHQIRAHLAHLGYPIVVDGLYGNGEGIYLSALKPGYRGGRAEEPALLGRLGLHAWSLAFVHPLSGEQVSFNAPYPQDFQTALKRLKTYRSLSTR
jgi:23S rRNA pseudouridine955/2504/2580 synthase/23S rRNA pseudouridine1911/1915/1917 synthase